MAIIHHINRIKSRLHHNDGFSGRPRDSEINDFSLDLEKLFDDC